MAHDLAKHDRRSKVTRLQVSPPSLLVKIFRWFTRDCSLLQQQPHSILPTAADSSAAESGLPLEPPPRGYDYLRHL